jgi:hypothetical protein
LLPTLFLLLILTAAIGLVVLYLRSTANQRNPPIGEHNRSIKLVDSMFPSAVDAAEQEIDVPISNPVLLEVDDLTDSLAPAVLREEVLEESLDQIASDGYFVAAVEDEKVDEKGLRSLRIVSWKEHAKWMVGGTLGSMQDNHAEAMQLGLKLEFARNSRVWRLLEIDSPITVLDGKTSNSTFVGRIPLTFKLSKVDSSRGVLTKRLTKGTYLAVAPTDWQRDDSVSGLPPIAPEATAFAGFAAHYFSIENVDDVIAFRDSAGALFVLKPEISNFELAGRCLPAIEENLGPLYGPQLPIILANSSTAFGSVAAIRLEEIGGRSSDCAFEKLIENHSLRLNPASICSGTYVARILGKSNDPLAALPFRVATALSSINFEPYAPVPPESGYKATLVKVIHDQQSRLDVAPFSIASERLGELTDIHIPPAQDADNVQITYTDREGGCINFSIRLNRVWWRLRNAADGTVDAPCWTDESISITQRALRATSKQSIEFLFPAERWAQSLLIGFENDSRRRYLVKVNERTLRIPLREFGTSHLISESITSDLRATIVTEAAHYEVTVANTKLSSKCKLCELEFPSKSEFLNHLNNHSEKLFREISTDERAQLEPTLPQAIYYCERCDSDIVISVLVDPVLTMNRHFMYSCTGASSVNRAEYVELTNKKDLLDQNGKIRVCVICEETFDGEAILLMSEHSFAEHGDNCHQLV